MLRTLKMKRLLGSFLAIALLFLVAACGQPGASAPTPSEGGTGGSEKTDAEASVADDWIDLDLTYATYLPEGNPNTGSILMLQYQLDQVMPGKVTITPNYSGTLLAQNNIYDGVLQGVADIGYVDLGTVAERFPLSQLFVYPGIGFNSSWVSGEAFNEWVQTEKPAEFDDIVFLFPQGSGPLALLTKKPVRTIEDVKGLQIRASAVAAHTINSWGSTPVTLTTGEVYEALRSGLIDGVYGFFGGFMKDKLDELATEVMISNLSNLAYIYVMNKETFNSMPESQQEAFMAAAQKAFEEYTNDYNELGGEIPGVISYPGMDQPGDPDAERALKVLKVYFLDPDTPEYAKFEAASSELLDNYAKSLDAKGLDGTGQLAKIREIAEKYNSQITWEQYREMITTEETNVVNP